MSDLTLDQLYLLPGIYKSVGKLEQKLRLCKAGSQRGQELSQALNMLENQGSTILFEIHNVLQDAGIPRHAESGTVHGG